MNKKILHLAIPNILSNITVPLLSSVDTAVMGHLESPVYLGAIAIGSMIFNFIYWGFGFLRMGTTGLTAQAFGSENQKEISATLFRALGISLALGLLIIIVQVPISKLSFYLIEGSNNVEIAAQEYFDIRIFAAPATLAIYSVNGWFLGMQNARYPLYLALFINLSNILLNLMFVYGFKMNVDGVAWGTLISQYTGFLVSLIIIHGKFKDVVRLFHIPIILNRDKIRKFFSVNTDIFFRTLLLIFAISFFTAKSAELNNEILAANFILMQLWLITSYGVDGFAFAAESLVGKYVGSMNKEKLLKTIKYSFYWGISLGAFIGLVYFIFSKQIISLYTSQSNVIDAAMLFMGWVIISPIVNSISFIWDGIFFGATETRAMLYSMVISTIFVFLPMYYISVSLIGNHSLWLSLTIFMIVRGVSLTLFYHKKIKFMLTKE